MKLSPFYRFALSLSLVGLLAAGVIYFSSPARVGSGAQTALAGTAIDSSLPLAHLQAPLAEFDFESVGGRIFIPAEVNGHQTSAVLDTGANASVMDLALAEQWNLPTQGELNIHGTGNTASKGKFLSQVKVTFGQITEQILYAVPLGLLTAIEGRRFETIIGTPFFQAHVVEVDYAKRHVRIFKSQAQIPSKGMVIPLRFVDNHPHITAEMMIGGNAYQLETMVDIGAAGTSLTAKFLKGHPLKVTTTAQTVISTGVRGNAEGRLFRPEAVKIGNVSLAKPVMRLTESLGGGTGENSSYDLLLGTDLLRRFRVTFDYAHQRMILEPGDEVAQPFEADKTGLRIHAREPDWRSFKVAAVLPGSSAESAGIKVDDVIETIDGAPASKYTLAQLRELFKSPTATKWELGLRRGEQQLKLMVTAKSII